MFRVFASILLCVSLFFTLPALAQSGKVSGTITDTETGETLIGVNLKLGSDPSVGTATDIDGNYVLQVPAGKVELQVTYVGFEDVSRIVEVASGGSVIVNFQLAPESRLMNQVVITGSKFEKRLGEETVSMEIIKPSQLANINATSVEDAIERVPGVNVLDGQVNIRGGSGYSYGAGTRVLLLYNDMPILQADAGFPNWSAVPIENIGQVELIKGAASALYGSSAINGIINLRSADPVSKPFFKLSTFYTTYNNPRDNGPDSLGQQKAWWRDSADITIPYETGVNLAYRKKFGQFDLTAGGYYFKEESFRQGEFDHRGRISALTRYRFKNIDGLSVGANVNFQVGTSGSFFIWNGTGAQAYNFWESIGEPTTTDGMRLTIDPFLNYFDDRGNNHSLKLRYNQVDNDNTNNQGNFSKFYYGEYQYQRRMEDIDLTLTGGVVGNYVNVTADLYADSVRTDEDDDGVLEWVEVGDPLDGSNLSAYVQADKRFFGSLNLSLGARLESNNISFTERETKTVFRAGLNYQAAEYTYIRASWGQGYRFPTIAEKFISTVTGLLVIAPNPDLVSETGWNGEIGLKQGLRIGKFDALFDFAAFYQEYQDMMEFTYTLAVGNPLIGGFQSQNIGDTRIYGVDVSLGGEGKLGKFPVRMLAGYTYTLPQYQDFTDEVNDRTSCDENILTFRFKHSVKAEADIEFGNFTLGTNLQYYSFMECIDAVFNGEVIPGILPGVPEFRADHNGGDIIWDLRAGLNIGEHVNVTALVKNVMNREYSIRPARIDAPRNYTLRVEYTLGQ